MRSFAIHPLRAAAPWLAATLLVFLGAGELSAQYFGRNNPQFRTFDFEVLRTDHFDVFYYPEATEGAHDAARMAERWYDRLSRILGHEFRERQPLILYASHADFQQTNILGSPVGEGTGGVTESFKQRVIMPLAHTYGSTDHVLGHEIVHAFQYDISGLGRSAGSIDAGARAIAMAPLWFIEGMAEYLTLGPVDSHTAMWLRDAALTGELPTLQQLATDPRIFPYRYGHALWAYITGRWGDAVVGEILRSVGQGAPYQQALERTLNTTTRELSEEWHAAIRRTYLPLLADHPEARQVGVPLVTRDARGGRLNLGPALSPDGTRMAFLSERGALDVELWLADAETGEIIRRLVRGTAMDAHFASLNFIASAGSFSPDGRQLVFSVLRRGQNVIALVDAERGGVTRRIAVPGVPEITNPSWSPDGTSIVFAGTAGGMTNLYLLDLNTEEARQLTSGRTADIMPEFSPDGTRIVFATDRGPQTNVEALQFGPYNIAVLDLATEEIEVLPGMAGHRNYNPAWAPDGQTVYFISDRTGIANIYRANLATGETAPVTEIFQGISGITPLSPALASSRGAERIVFSAYEDGGYNLYRLDDAGAVTVTAVGPETMMNGEAVPMAAVLPPAPRPEEVPYHRVTDYLADPITGLPTPQMAAAWPIEPYRPRLSLDYLGQPMVGFSTGGAFGQGGLYGGIAGVWSDMLAHHTLWGVLQAQGSLDETGFSAAWLYRPLRWDLGVLAQRIPYISAGRAQGFDPEEGVFRDQVIAVRTFDWTLQGVAQYALSRSQRVEFTAGPRRMARDVRIQEVVYDPVIQGGQIVGFVNPRFQDRREAIDDFNLVEAKAALVFDNALFGWTSPFAGQRYRFEVAPAAGTFQFLTGLADYRRYLWLRPFTLAARGLHFGRYGLDAEEEERIGTLFIGQPSLLRGYPYGDTVERCRAGIEASLDEAEACRVLEHLFGQRLGIVNLELRFPLIQALVLGTGFGIPPIEGFAFFDAGTTWAQGTRPIFEGGIPTDPAERGVLSSTGVGARINLFGYAVLEVDYVRPLVGDRGWFWQFGLQPGF